MTQGRVARYLPLVVAAVISASCGGGDEPTNPSNRLSLVQTLTLDETHPQLYMGEKRALNVTFRAANGNVIPYVEGEEWLTSNASLVTVNQDGEIEAIGLGGPVTITVRANERSTSVTFTVIPADVRIAAADSTLSVGQVVQLTGTPVDLDGTPLAGLQVRWSSSEPGIATVDENSGVMTAVALGTTIITASSAGRSQTMIAEVGVPSQWDGDWTGTLPAAESSSRSVKVRFSVVFGTVRYFTLTNEGKTSTCVTVRVHAPGPNKVDIVDAAFSMTIVPEVRETRTPQSPGTVTASFTSPSTLEGTVTDFSFGNVDCPSNGGLLGGLLGGAVSAGAVTAVRQ